MATTEERMQILKMVSEKKITAEEGAKLLSALEPDKKRESQVVMVGGPSTARWLRIRVTDLETGKSKVNVNLPISLVNVGMKMGARFAPEIEGFDMNEIFDQIREGAQGKMIDVEDVEDGERVEIYVE